MTVLHKLLNGYKITSTLTTGNLMKIELLPTQKWWYELMLGYDMVDEKGVQVNLINEIFLNLGPWIR